MPFDLGFSGRDDSCSCLKYCVEGCLLAQLLILFVLVAVGYVQTEHLHFSRLFLLLNFEGVEVPLMKL